MKSILLKAISLYQSKISAYTRPSCVFYPVCSEYARLAITKHGVVQGLWLALVRILRCHPWQKNHLDPVP